MSSWFASRSGRALATRRLLLRRLLFATLPAIAGGCDFPLDPPVWTTEWSLDLIREVRAVGEFLPSGVTVDGSGFVIEPLRVSNSVRLEDVCEACTCFNGPVPALKIEPLDWNLPAPGRLSSANLTAGVATLVLHNRVGFDLLRRPDGVFGSLLVELVDTRSDVTHDSVRVVQSFPAGDSLSVSFQLDGLELQRNLVARVSAQIPGSGCDAVALAEGPTIGADVTIDAVRAGTVFVLLSDNAVRVSGRSVDLPNWLGNRLRTGDARLTLMVEATNGLATEVEVELSVAGADTDLFGGAAALVTPFRIAPGSADAPVTSARPFVIDVSALTGADQLAIGTRARILGGRRVELTGAETLEYRAVLRAEVPSR